MNRAAMFENQNSESPINRCGAGELAHDRGAAANVARVHTSHRHGRDADH